MKQFPKLRPTLWDGLVVLSVLLLLAVSVLGLWHGGQSTALTAVISVDGETVEQVDLSKLEEPEEKTLHANGYTLHLRLDATGAVVAESDCPTQDCVHTGKITRSGQSIICLPARVTIQLSGAAEENDVDVVIG